MMKKPPCAHVIIILLSLSCVYGGGSTRPLPCLINNLWLDVAVAIDYSNNMGTHGILQALADVVSVFSPTNISQSLGRTTRLGIVNYTYAGDTLVPLNYYRTTSQMSYELFNLAPSETTDADGFMNDGLVTAASLLRRGRQSGTRKNVPQAIIVYASEFSAVNETDAITQAGRLKADGITIIIIDNSKRQHIQNLSSVASPGMVFQASNTNLIQLVQGALCSANSFCKSGWTQVSYSSSFPTQTTIRQGECAIFNITSVSRESASSQCNSIGGYLVNVFDRYKDDFVMGLSQQPGQYFYYWIGLTYNTNTGVKEWDQMPLQNVIPVTSGDYNGYVKGDSGQYSPSASQPFVVMQGSVDAHASNRGWFAQYPTSYPFVCQAITCDTDNYCG